MVNIGFRSQQEITQPGRGGVVSLKHRKQTHALQVPHDRVLLAVFKSETVDREEKNMDGKCRHVVIISPLRSGAVYCH